MTQHTCAGVSPRDGKILCVCVCVCVFFFSISAPCREVYDKCSSGFSGRCTAPLLVDKVTKQAVCNDSGLLLDNLYSIAQELPMSGGIDLKPPDLAQEIDELNSFIYNSVNNAVYRYAPTRLWAVLVYRATAKTCFSETYIFGCLGTQQNMQCCNDEQSYGIAQPKVR